MTDILTNLFCMLGSYRMVTVLWQLHELKTGGKITPTGRDTAIGLALSVIITVSLAIGRG